MNGFILLARSILESEVFASQKMLKIWIWCLCKANHKDKFVSIKTGRGETTVKVKRSQFLFGRFKAEEELGIDGSTIYKHMQKLQDIGNIEIKSNSHYSIISICNYDTYQQAEAYKVTGNEQAKDKQVTGNEQASNTTNNDKNVKNVKTFYTDQISENSDHKFLEEYKMIVGGLIDKNYSNVLAMQEQLKFNEYCSLRDQYTKERIIYILKAMENYKKLKNNKSIYLTAANWLRREDVR